MEKEKEKIIFKIKPFDLWTIFLRAFGIFMMLLIIFNFSYNPIFFSILTAFPLSIFLFTRTSQLIITNTDLIIEHKNLIEKMSNKVIIEIVDIKDIVYQKEFKPIGRNILPMGYMLTKPNTVIIKTKDKNISQTQIGSKKDFEQAVMILKKMLN